MIKSWKAFFFFATIALLLASCVTFSLPKNYITDDKVVFLREKLEFGPIRYDPIRVDPYTFSSYTGDIKSDSPDFLKISNFNSLLAPDYIADSKLYLEVVSHLEKIAASTAYTQLRVRLDGEEIAIQPPLPVNCGDQTKTYSNGGQYAYPDVPGALITVLNDGEYFIDFPDGSSFKYYKDGSYARFDSAGKEIFALYKSNGTIIMTDGDAVFTTNGTYRKIVTGLGTLVYNTIPAAQYEYTPTGAPALMNYIFFIASNNTIFEKTITNAAKIRFDYLTDGKEVLITYGAQAIQIAPDFSKQHSVFDTKLNKATSILSIFLPEGIRLANLPGPGLSYADLNPRWPENYKSISIGPFTVLYTAKDQPLIAKLNAAKLSAIEVNDRKLIGLEGTKGRTIIIPPDLTSYCRLQASQPGTTLNWYPSGFEHEDYIVMWPFSVPRYNSSAGQDYFFQQEFYEIVAHEFAHLLIGENTGILSPVPVWLNEGIAVYVESQSSEDCHTYWDTVFEVSKAQHALLDWDRISLYATGEFPIAEARVDYAQSFALVSALIDKYGAAKVANYVKSFRLTPEESQKANLKDTYKANFKAIFGIDFSEALKLLETAN